MVLPGVGSLSGEQKNEAALGKRGIVIITPKRKVVKKGEVKRFKQNREKKQATQVGGRKASHLRGRKRDPKVLGQKMREMGGWRPRSAQELAHGQGRS